MLEFEKVARAAGVFRDIRRYRLVWNTDDANARAASPGKAGAVLLNSDGVALPAVTVEVNRGLLFSVTVQVEPVGGFVGFQVRLMVFDPAATKSALPDAV